MGVHGITKYLEERGLLPTTRNIDNFTTATAPTTNTGTRRVCCSSELWNEWNPSLLFRLSSSCSNGGDGGGPSSSSSSSSSSSFLLPQPVPVQSKLLLDGNGVAFYLYQIAYAKYIQTIFPTSITTATSTPTTRHVCPTIKSLDSAISQALPSMMPLAFLRQVTHEFATTLLELQNDVEVHCYWDGGTTSAKEQREQDDEETNDNEEPLLSSPILQFKQSTLLQRHGRRQEEWASLQTYCQHGTIPVNKTANEPICSCLYRFPPSKLFLQCVQQTLESISVTMAPANNNSGGTSTTTTTKSIHMVYCPDEADAALAHAASGDPTAFVVGQDSDFLFYKQIQYIPLQGGMYLSTSSSAATPATAEGAAHNGRRSAQRQLYVTCLTRSKIATALGFDDDDNNDDDDDDDDLSSEMVELALLLGNDYVDPLKMLKLPAEGTKSLSLSLSPRSVSDKIQYLQSQIAAEKKSFQWQAKSKQYQPILHFVRCLYNLQPFEYPVVGENENENENKNDEKEQENQVAAAAMDQGSEDEHVSLVEQAAATATATAEPELVEEEDVGDSGRMPLAKEEEQDHQVQDIISVPSNFPLDQAVVLPTDTSIPNAIVRCLEMYLQINTHQPEDEKNRTEDAPSSVLEQCHLDAYQACTSLLGTATAAATTAWMLPSSSSFSSQISKTLLQRPQWKDICAAYIIETCIGRAMAVSKHTSLLARQTRVETLMPHWNFHCLLAVMRSQKLDESTAAIQPGKMVDPPPPIFVERPVLPIDEYQDRILEQIETNRVTIIHGETGCGKSSRVPVMILEAPSPEPSLPRVKMFISQPRRIAAASLVERVRSCEPDHRDKFAVRMGHGYREYESGKTQAWFVTTGYLTRLLANHPEKFDDVTHLIIDEVHERSVDTDILCLLCRRLLENNQKIRLVLMSATLATKLYKDYFKVPSDPIHVGVRRFPIQEYFVEDLCLQNATFKLPPKERQAAMAIQKECESKRCNSAPTQAELSKRFTLAARLATIVGVPGSSVLIFVPGMNEIISITEAIESFYQPGINYVCYPIHSDVPFEEQMGAFDAPGPDEVKVIIATNAAESSVTLPAVDHVICLGLCRQIMYNKASHRQILLPCWISKASATQRAGRTGRVRPGNVYRLYTRTAYENYMDEFEQGEMVRIPLDSIILMLKEMLHEEVMPVLMNCIEPPKMETIEKSFESLHHWNFLTEPNDLAEITNLGTFVSALGIDLALGSFIGLGIQFGVAAEAIEMAAIMSFPKSPFQYSNPLFHNPAQFNEIISKTYVSKCHFDANLYSEPLAMMNALWDYHMSQNRAQWCKHYRFVYAKMNQLHSTRDSLRKRVAIFLGINDDKLQVQTPPVLMPQYKLMILRTLKVWVFSDTIIECQPTALSTAPDGSVSIKVPRNKFPISNEMLGQILDERRHPHRIVESRTIEGRGEFENQGPDFSLEESIEQIQSRLVSYMIEYNIDAGILADSEQTFAFFNEEIAERPTLANAHALANSLGQMARLQAEMDLNAKRRGVLERKCGLWKVTTAMSGARPSQTSSIKRAIFRRINHSNSSLDLKGFIHQAMLEGEISSMIGFVFARTKKKNKNLQPFQFFSKGDCKEISRVDLKDFVGASDIVLSTSNTQVGQSILFLPQKVGPCPHKGKGKELMATSIVSKESSWNHPLIEDVPEGVRVVSVLASAQRKGGHRLRFPDPKSDNPEDSLDVFLVQEETRIGMRWCRIGTERKVYVQEDTVQASATSIKVPLFACCSNALDLNGGGMKVEGLTLLPPNPLFLLVCRLAFGLGPIANPAIATFSDAGSSTSSNLVLQQGRALSWLKDRCNMAETGVLFPLDKHEATKKICQATEFHESCSNMGESLVCFPDKIKALCDLLDGLVEDDVSFSEECLEKSLTPENLSDWQKERKGIIKTTAASPTSKPHNTNGTSDGKTSEASSAPVQSEPPSNGKQTNDSKKKKKRNNPRCLPKGTVGGSSSSSKVQSKNGTSTTFPQPKPPNSLPNGDVGASSSKARINIGASSKSTQPNAKPKPQCHVLRNFDRATLEQSRHLFATTRDSNIQLSPTDFPSTNILALVLEQFALQVFNEQQNVLAADNSKPVLDPTKIMKLDLESKYWDILVIREPKSSNRAPPEEKMYYQARIQMEDDIVPLTPLFGRGKNHLPKWMKKHLRPHQVEDAKACVPHTVVPIPEPKVIHFTKSDRPTLAFESLETALRMEAAFYLERQFAVANKQHQGTSRHWYDYGLHEMVAILFKLWKQRSSLVDGQVEALEE